MSISVIITSAYEPNTIGKATESLLPQTTDHDEILIITPDQETINAASKFADKNPNIKIIQDDGRGKPTAINLGLKNAKNEVIVLTDGDVWIDDEAISELLRSLDNSKVGLVSGRPMSINDENNLFGFWAHVLTDVAHQIRRNKELRITNYELRIKNQKTKKPKNLSIQARANKQVDRQQKTDNNFPHATSYQLPVFGPSSGRGTTNYQFIEASGYLMVFRKKLIDHIPEDSLAEDKVISQMIWLKGYQIRYAENAKVFVKYPDNYSDWLKQKIRSTGGSMQNIVKNAPSMRSFWQESRGVIKIFSYAKNLKEFCWIILLLLARLHLWWRILIDVKIRKLSRRELWERVKSTK